MFDFIYEVLDIVLRSFISIIVLFFLAKLMGKKQIAQLTFFDYVIGISIGSIAAAFAVDNSINYAHGLTGLIIYALLALLLSIINLKSVKLRELISGTPTILIQDGKFIEKNLKKAKFHINDVLEQCRILGTYNINDVQFAILETSGKVSVMLKPGKETVTAEDMNITKEYQGICADLIIDGVIMHKHLKMLHLDELWLNEELRKQNILNIKDVLLATIDNKSNLSVHLKQGSPKPYDVIE